MAERRGMVVSKKRKEASGPLGGGEERKAVVKKKEVKDVRQRSRDWSSCWRASERRSAVLKALDAIFKMSAEQSNFERFGNDVIQCFYDVASATSDPIRGRALMYVEQLAQRWRYAVLQRGWRGELEAPPPITILDTIVGLYCMERVGVASANLKRDVAGVLARVSSSSSSAETTRYGPADYFGWDPTQGPAPEEGAVDPASEHRVSKYRATCTALTYAFYVDSVGLSVGCGYDAILSRVQSFRPYKGPRDFDEWDDYVDQCYLCTHIVFTLSNWGELALEPKLLPHEYLFIREHFLVAVRQRDVHLVGEYVECLRVFGASDADGLVKLGVGFLLSTQSQETHRWDSDQDAYTSYHATMVAAQGLIAHVFRGYGPGLSSAVPVLAEWARDFAIAGGGASSSSSTIPEHPDKAIIRAVALMVEEDARRAADDREQKTTTDDPLSDRDTKTAAALPRGALTRADSSTSVDIVDMVDIVESTPADRERIAQIEVRLKDAVKRFNWPVALEALSSLADQPVDVAALKETTLGRTVNDLKKVDDPHVANRAKLLVKKWRRVYKSQQHSTASASRGTTTTTSSSSSSSSHHQADT